MLAVLVSDAGQFLDKVQVRENLNETAFFYPALESDNQGNVAIKFTLPESVTTWKFMGLAHDKEMRNGLLVDEAVAQKTVMVQPNMPRFLREGDKSYHRGETLQYFRQEGERQRPYADSRPGDQQGGLAEDPELSASMPRALLPSPLMSRD